MGGIDFFFGEVGFDRKLRRICFREFFMFFEGSWVSFN